MQKQVSLTSGKGVVGNEDSLLSDESETAAYHGRLKQARDFSQRAAEIAKLGGTTEVAAGWIVRLASQEAEFGNSSEARRSIASAMQLAPHSRYVPATASLALALSGDATQAQKIADGLERDFPQDTILNSHWLPMTRGAIALDRHHSVQALEALRAAQSYELGAVYPDPAPLGPIFLRGYAYLGQDNTKKPPLSSNGYLTTAASL